MAEKLPEEDGPSLELPSLFGRRRKRSVEEDAAQPAAPTDRRPEPEPVREPRESQPVAEPEPLPRPELEPEPEPEPEPTVVLPAAPTPPPAPVEIEPEAERRRELRLPAWASSTAALVVGGVVGALGCALTWIGLQGCELVTGTDSCGGPGLLVLVVILAAMVAAGVAALRLFGVQDAANLSLLGVGLLATVVLFFLTDHLYDPWMLVGIPALTALCFWVAHAVTTSHVDEADLERPRPEPHDVR